MSGSPGCVAASLQKAAFSLVELLVVMGVMTLLMGMAVPAMSSMAKGSQMNQALSDVTGMLEMARQYATAQNTYVWVAFNDEAASQGPDEQVRVAVLASKSGADLSTWGVDDTTSAAAATQLLVKPRTFNQVKLSDGSVFKSKISDLPLADTSKLGTANFTIKIQGAQNEAFTKAVQFTPSGEARTGASMTGLIDVGLQPTHGRVANDNNVAVVRVNGLTGQTRIFRP